MEARTRKTSPARKNSPPESALDTFIATALTATTIAYLKSIYKTLSILMTREQQCKNEFLPVAMTTLTNYLAGVAGRFWKIFHVKLLMVLPRLSD